MATYLTGRTRTLTFSGVIGGWLHFQSPGLIYDPVYPHMDYGIPTYQIETVLGNWELIGYNNVGGYTTASLQMYPLDGSGGATTYYEIPTEGSFDLNWNCKGTWSISAPVEEVIEIDYGSYPGGNIGTQLIDPPVPCSIKIYEKLVLGGYVSIVVFAGQLISGTATRLITSSNTVSLSNTWDAYQIFADVTATSNAGYLATASLTTMVNNLTVGAPDSAGGSGDKTWDATGGASATCQTNGSPMLDWAETSLSASPPREIIMQGVINAMSQPYPEDIKIVAYQYLDSPGLVVDVPSGSFSSTYTQHSYAVSRAGPYCTSERPKRAPDMYQAEPPDMYQPEPPDMYQAEPPDMYQAEPPGMYQMYAFGGTAKRANFRQAVKLFFASLPFSDPVGQAFGREDLMERLTMRDITEIIYRLRKGQSERAIAADMKRHRVTVHQYRAFAEQKGYLKPDVVLPSEEQLLREFGPVVAPPRIPSSVDPFAALVKQWVKDEVRMRTMHRLLCEDHGFTGSYTAVRRFVAAQHPTIPEVFVRIETAPGEEAQVDFGTVGKLFNPSIEKLRTAYCFVMTLSHSRHQYVEFVFDQKIATWVGCHKRAFAYFGGVVERVVVDNLKAAVLVHDLEDPVLCVPYKKMAQHYGFLISPCRPRTPRHKGKVESGIAYVKGNLWPGLKERKVGEANAEAIKWLENHAGLRTHGTTRKQPIVQFQQVEQQRLAPLPEHPFDLMTVREAGVRPDQHLCAEYSYYSAPREYVGKKLEVYLFEKTVQLYDGVKLVFTHPRATEPGQRITHPGHQPEHKVNYLQLTPQRCQERATEIGAFCREVVETMLADKPKDKRRAMAALISLAEKYGEQRLEAACRRAIAWQDPRYTRVKHTLLNELDEAVLADDAQIAVVSVYPAYRYARSAEEFFGDTTSVRPPVGAPARQAAIAC